MMIQRVNGFELLMHLMVVILDSFLGWEVIVFDQMVSRGVDLKSFFNIKVGNEHGTRFWFDKWMEDQTLKDRFHRMFVSNPNPHALVSDRNSWINCS